MAHDHSYVPALSIDALTRFYDPLLATIFQERRFRMPVVNAMHVLPGARVLDIGCGTATLSLLIDQHTAVASVVGLDIDPVMLAMAQAKVQACAAAVYFTDASADTLPYVGGSFDHVVSSMMFHHLATAQKHGMLREAWRVLRPGGMILILDFGPIGRGAVAEGIAAMFGRFEHVNDNLYGRVPAFLREAGFTDAETSDVAFAGLVKLYSGRKPK
jgi:ubiquinone/menaquinone biosynthesis C-methylase UbiE